MGDVGTSAIVPAVTKATGKRLRKLPGRDRRAEEAGVSGTASVIMRFQFG